MKPLLSIVPVPILLLLAGSQPLRPAQHQTPVKKALTALGHTLFDITKTVGYGNSIVYYLAAADIAAAAGETQWVVKYLNNAGGCQMAVFQFQEALQTFQRAKSVAQDAGIREVLATINSNISSLYQELGNEKAAAQAAEDAVLVARDMKNVPRAGLYSHLGTLRARMENMEGAEEAFRMSIDLATEAAGYEDSEPGAERGAREALANAWDSLAYARRKAGRIQEAEGPATEGFLLRKLFGLGAMDSSLVNLAAVRGSQGDLRSALHLMEAAKTNLGNPRSVTPAWEVYQEKGEIELIAGDLPGAFQDLQECRKLARDWRVDVVANDANRTKSEERLASLYESLIEAGNRLYLAHPDESLIRATFDAAEENRAASLRDLLPQKNDWRRNLPSRYYSLLAKLKLAEAARLSQNSHSDSADLENLAGLRSQLDQMEAAAAGPRSAERPAPLDQAIRSLDSDSAIVSFQLGERHSWRWTLTRNGLTLKQIPNRVDLAAQVQDFRAAVEGNRATLTALSQQLYRSLFGDLTAEVLAKQKWILLLDRELFDLPFPALSQTAGTFLVEEHALQIASGALLMKPGKSSLNPPQFLGIGDPIYNWADSRAKSGGSVSWPGFLSRAGYGQGPNLARLWGTGREIEVSAKTWGPPTRLLEGAEASPESFWKAVAAQPDIIHFATHVIDGREESHSGWIALSMGANGQVQYITPSDILARSVAARLVVLSGCSSGKADAPSATGLMGLTRAWLAAGAGSVLATRWPTVDDDGAFFRQFYRFLARDSSFDPAEALRRASVEVLKSNTWRANPSFWAGYFLVGNS